MVGQHWSTSTAVHHCHLLFVTLYKHNLLTGRFSWSYDIIWFRRIIKCDLFTLFYFMIPITTITIDKINLSTSAYIYISLCNTLCRIIIYNKLNLNIELRILLEKCYYFGLKIFAIFESVVNLNNAFIFHKL